MVAAVPEPTEPVVLPARKPVLRVVTHGHAHEWRLVADDVDEFGPVRMFGCTTCDHIRYE